MVRTRRRTLALVALGVCVLAPAACSGAGEDDGTEAPAAVATDAADAAGSAPAADRPLPAGPLVPLAWSDFEYVGSFRCPPTKEWAFLQYTGLTYVPTRGTLIVMNRTGLVELTVPSPVRSANDNPEDLPIAEELTPPFNLFDAVGDWLPFPKKRLGGIAWLDGRLWIACFEFYNAAARDNPGIVSLTDRFEDPRGAWRVGPAGVNQPIKHLFHANKTNSYLCAVPPSWAAEYAPGTVLASGRQRGAGAFGGAQGPTLYAFRPSLDVPPGGNFGAVPLMIFPTDSRTWADGTYRNDDDYEVTWVWTDKGQTILVGSTKALGQDVYGPGPEQCYPAKGWHAPPYQPRIYLMDPRELGEVAQGRRQPWDLRPYETLVPDFPWRTAAKGESPECRHPWFAGLAYDPRGRRVFVLQTKAYDTQGYDASVIHVLQVSDG